MMEITTSSRTLIGVAVAVAGNIMISVALNCQKLAHTRLQKQQASADTGQQNGNTASRRSSSGSSSSTTRRKAILATPESDSSTSSSNSGMDTMFLRSKLWWLGIALMTLGEAGNFISYGFAPASLVAPLGAVALLSNVIISPILLKEQFRALDLGGIFLAIVGAVTVVFSSKQNDVRLGPGALLDAIKRLEFVIFASIALGAGLLLAFLSQTSLADRWVLIDIGACAVFGGFTVLSTKGISSLISDGEPLEALKFPITYCLVAVLAGTAVIQITYLNKALQRFDSRQVIPTQFVLFTISAIVGSAILYRDFENMDAHRLVNFLFGCLTTFAGVFVLTWRNGESQYEDEGQEQSDSEHEESVDPASEESPLLPKSWHEGDQPPDSERGRIGPRIDVQHDYGAGSSALRVPNASDQTRRSRSHNNSPQKANASLSRSWGDRSASGGLSRSSASAQHQPRLSHRPTGLSPGHYLLLAATPPPSFNLNLVQQGTSSSTASTKSPMLLGKGQPSTNLLPLPTTAPGKRIASDRVSADEAAALSRTSAPSTAESIVTPVAATSGSSSPNTDLVHGQAVAKLTTQTQLNTP